MGRCRFTSPFQASAQRLSIPVSLIFSMTSCRDCRVTEPVERSWELGLGPPPNGRCGADMGPRSDGTRILNRQDVAMKGVRLQPEEVGTGVLV